MSYYNNFFETEEQKRKRMSENNSNTTPFNPIASQTPIKPLEQMSTREVLEYAWDKSEKENASKNTNYIPIPERKPRYAELNFDGKKVDWVENDQVINSWPAMSGNASQQNIASTSIPENGPIPEGSWNVPQKNLQNFDDLSSLQKLAAYCGRRFWPKGKIAWGNHRIQLEPDETTNTMGRKNLFLHGGISLGSRGCVDLAENMDDFVDEYKKYGRDMLMRVKYPKTW